MAENQNPQSVKNALCYIPVVPFVLYFTEEKKTEEFERHIRYGMILFIVFLILTIFLRSVFLGILILVYIVVSVYLGYKAYVGEDVRINFVDDIFEKNEKKVKKEKDVEEEVVIVEEEKK